MAAFLPPTPPLAAHPTIRGAAACRVLPSVASVASVARRRAAVTPSAGRAARRARRGALTTTTTTTTAMAEPPAEQDAAATPAANPIGSEEATTTAAATKEPQKQTVFGAVVFGFIMAIMALGLVATLARGFVPDGLVGPA